jgi:hypothetical protein
MDSRLEAEQAPQLRTLCRQYSEGRFNKQEYRQRRRDLIVLCSGEAPLRRESEAPEETDAVLPLGKLFAGLSALMLAVLAAFQLFE